MVEVDAQPGAVVLAARPADRLPLECAVVRRKCLVGECPGAFGPALDQVIDLERGIGADESLRNRVRLGEKEPVVHRLRVAVVHHLRSFEGRDDIEQRQLPDPFGVIQRQPVAHAGAPVVARQQELLVTQFGHRCDHVFCHDAVGVVGRLGLFGPRAVAVPPQVRRDDGVLLGQPGGEVVLIVISYDCCCSVPERTQETVRSDRKTATTNRLSIDYRNALRFA